MNEFIYNIKQNKLLAIGFVFSLSLFLIILSIFLDNFFPNFSFFWLVFYFIVFTYACFYIHYFIEVVSSDFKRDNKTVWVLIFIFIPLSVVFYLLFGKKYLEEEKEIKSSFILIYLCIGLILGVIASSLISGIKSNTNKQIESIQNMNNQLIEIQREYQRQIEESTKNLLKLKY